MKKIILFSFFINAFYFLYPQTKLAKDKVYNRIDSIKIANPDSVFNVVIGFTDHVTSIPKCLFKLKNLRNLTIVCYSKNLEYSNYVKKIPKKITQLNKLRKLTFVHASIGNIPAYICKLDSLEELTFGWCKVESIPETIGELQNLKRIEIENNGSDTMKSIPASIKNLKKMQFFMIVGCYFKNDSIIAYKERLPEKCYKNFGAAIDCGCK